MHNKWPIIMLNIVSLPFKIDKIEIKDEIEKKIIDVAIKKYDSLVFITNRSSSIEKQPPYGVISKIEKKIELPNGNYKIIITGLYRIKILDWEKPIRKNFFWQIKGQKIKIEVKEEEFLCSKLKKELTLYIKTIPYVSNSILSELNKVNDLSTLTDVVCLFLQESNINLKPYIYLIDPKDRFLEILKFMNKEKELFQLEKEIDLKVRSQLDENQKEYVLREKIKTIQEKLGDLDFRQKEIQNIKEKIKKINAPKPIIQRLNQELKRYEAMSYTSPEQNIIYQYIEHLLNIPFGKYKIENDDLLDVKQNLDKSHYGLKEAKDRIIEYLAVKKLTNRLTTPILCLVGPPGVGKTSFVESLAKSMHRDFVKISVGGMNDVSELIGHRRTYIGASPGRIIQGLQKVHSMNPVFLIDEIDKITKTYKGDPASILLEILDTIQNKHFSDYYIEEEVDLSKVFFITTANSLDTIPSALIDRLEIINLSGYTELEKIDIASYYLLPKVCMDHGINIKSVNIQEDVLIKIIREYTKEAGVRELERTIATIIRKMVTKMVVDHNVKRKFNINKKNVTTYLKGWYNNSLITYEAVIGRVKGLAYTKFGGEVLNIEANYFKGTGELILTGSLGKVMKESAQIALDYIKANQEVFNIKNMNFDSIDIHIHIPDGAIPKDGPSAGIAMVTVLISLFTKKPIENDIAFTGEITLQGNVLPVGGLKEKIIGASREGINKIFLPKLNKQQVESELPIELKKTMQFVYVSNYKEVWKHLVRRKYESKINN